MIITSSQSEVPGRASEPREVEMFLITGASGQVGKRVAEFLAGKRHALRLMVRDLARAPQLERAETVLGDYSDPATLDRAFNGVDAAFVVSGYDAPGERAKLHKNAFEAAARAGVRHLVYLSCQGASPQSLFPMSRDHYESEQYLRESGVPFTALRDCFYLDLIPEMFGAAGVMRGPAGKGRAAWVSRDDVARVVATVLASPGETSAVYDVTGPEPLTMAETAERLSALAARELRYEEESLADAREWRSQLGAPEWEVETWVGSYVAIAAGEVAVVSDTVERLTGRRPQSLEQYFGSRPELLAPLRPASGT
jgi:NAD(P)H dehydrogenase (quinone)